MDDAHDTELMGPPREGRVFAAPRRAGLADCAPTGRMRLDGLARWLQDVAYADVDDAGLAASAVWVVRRRIRARLRHPAPGSGAPELAWRFRATECDIAGHVNNAAYWEPVEEELLRSADPERLDAEMEYRSPAQPGEKLVLRNGNRRWIVSPEGEVHASALLVAASPSGGG